MRSAYRTLYPSAVVGTKAKALKRSEYLSLGYLFSSMVPKSSLSTTTSLSNCHEGLRSQNREMSLVMKWPSCTEHAVHRCIGSRRADIWSFYLPASSRDPALSSKPQFPPDGSMSTSAGGFHASETERGCGSTSSSNVFAGVASHRKERPENPDLSGNLSVESHQLRGGFPQELLV